jgi:splicing factor U2AF subunit
MLNMVITKEPSDDQEYQDIYDNIKEECGGYREVLDLRIPGPTKKDRKWGD